MDLQKIDPEKNLMQHNAITSGRYDFSACQLDILFMILANLNKDDAANKVYSIYVKDIETITGRAWNYQQLQEASEEMGSRMFSIETAESYTQMWMFQSFEYVTGKGYFNVKLSEPIRPYLFDLKNNFTVFQLKAALNCTSKYAKRLYTLCCQWRNVGIVTFKIDDLKEMLFLKDPKGKEKEQFKKISQFQERVLEVAKRQINEHTDIQFDYEMIKRGRSFEFVKIYVGVQKSTAQLQIDFTEPVEFQKQVKTVMAYGIAETQAKQIAKKGYKEFEKVLKELKEKKSLVVNDPAAYLVGIMKNKGIL